MTTESTSESNVLRWVIAAIVVLALIALLAWARNGPGVGGRDPGPEDAAAATVIAPRPG